ncbi:MAG: cytochrome c [Nitrospinae bacterium]|nr:cytochrome c [Nitrospinota bacterium]
MRPSNRRGSIALLVLFLCSCAPQPQKEVPAEYKSGQKYFHQICSNCHNSDAMGGLTKAPKLIDGDYAPDGFSDGDIRDTVLNGTKKMPPQKGKLSEEQISEIIKYLRYSQKAAGLIPDEKSAEQDDDDEADGEEEDPAAKS